VTQLRLKPRDQGEKKTHRETKGDEGESPEENSLVGRFFFGSYKNLGDETV